MAENYTDLEKDTKIVAKVKILYLDRLRIGGLKTDFKPTQNPRFSTVDCGAFKIFGLLTSTQILEFGAPLKPL